MSQILFWNLSRQISNHHVKASEISVELSSRLYKCLPISRIFTHIVFSQFNTDLLKLSVESDHDVSKFGEVSNLIS